MKSILVFALGFATISGAVAPKQKPTSNQSYTCSGSEVGNRYNLINFRMSLNSQTVSTTDKLFELGVVDSKYTPRHPRNAGFLKYIPAAKSRSMGVLLVEKTLLTGGKILKNGRYGGLVQWRVEVEGGLSQYNLTCYHDFVSQPSYPQPTNPPEQRSKWDDCKLGELDCVFE